MRLREKTGKLPALRGGAGRPPPCRPQRRLAQGQLPLRTASSSWYSTRPWNSATWGTVFENGVIAGVERPLDCPARFQGHRTIWKLHGDFALSVNGESWAKGWEKPRKPSRKRILSEPRSGSASLAGTETTHLPSRPRGTTVSRPSSPWFPLARPPASAGRGLPSLLGPCWLWSAEARGTQRTARPPPPKEREARVSGPVEFCTPGPRPLPVPGPRTDRWTPAAEAGGGPAVRAPPQRCPQRTWEGVTGARPRS